MSHETYSASVLIFQAMMILATMFAAYGVGCLPAALRARQRASDDRAFARTMLEAYAHSLLRKSKPGVQA